ncbi:WXG100 family type VII secretion target [Nocardia nova]|uniref:WXG100 family type VII secretion target n=1 Tax=Nocardia nova TaxID=37330 RepID=UPI0033CA86E2
MSPGPGRATLKISEVEKWKPDLLATFATRFDAVVTKGDELLKSMVTEHDHLAETWKGAGADSAATRVTNEKTAASHLLDKVGGLKTVLTTHQNELAHAKQFVIDKRNLIVGMGFEVADDGTVTAEAKRTAVKAAAGNKDPEPGNVTMALLQVGYEAQQQHVAMLGALQHAENTAAGAKAAIDVANEAVNHVAMFELPPKAIRALFPGLTHPGTAQPNELPPVLGEPLKLQQGIPISVTNPDGSTTTTTPNPDGTMTVATSVQQPDGSTITTESTGDKPPTTTVTTKPDSAGVTGVTVTGPDGKSQQFQKVPEGNGRTSTYAVNADGSRGTKLSETYPQNGGTTTDRFGPDGKIDRQWQRPDGFRAFEEYAPGPDGKPQLVGTSNSAGVQSELKADGQIVTHYPDGKTATTKLDDGQLVTTFPDGSVLSFDPNQVPPGAPKPTVWDTVKSWTGSEWNTMYDSGKGQIVGHPVATGFAGMAGAASEWHGAVGTSMASQAGQAMAESHIGQMRALQMLDAGTPGAGHAFAGAMDSATDAATKAELGNLLKSDGKMLGGIPVGALTNAWVNYDDWHNYHKPADEAIANTVGGTAGGWAGALLGAQTGAWACSAGGPIGSAFCAGVGAAAGGFLLGVVGGSAAEQPFK